MSLQTTLRMFSKPSIIITNIRSQVKWVLAVTSTLLSSLRYIEDIADSMLRYHVPKEIQGHIDYITPGVKLVATQTHSSRAVEKRKLQNLARGRVSPVPPGDANYDPNDLSKCSGHVSPQCVRAMYNFTQATLAQPGNELGIYETGDDAAYLSPLDLNSFFTLFDQRIPNNTFPIVEGVDGAKNIKNEGVAGVEAAIDFQISYPIIYPQKSILFITDDVYYESLSYPKKGILNNFLDAIDGSYCTAASRDF